MRRYFFAIAVFSLSLTVSHAQTVHSSDRVRAVPDDARTVKLTGNRSSLARAEYDAGAAEFSPDEVAALVSLIVTINAWNAISVSTRAWVPGSYQP